VCFTGSSRRAWPGTDHSDWSMSIKEWLIGSLRCSLPVPGIWRIQPPIASGASGQMDDAPLPGLTEYRVSLAGGSSLVMFAKSEKKREVWRLIEYLSETGGPGEVLRAHGRSSSRIEAWKNSTAATNKYASAFFEN